MKFMFYFTAICILGCVSDVSPAKILGVFPIPGSHYILGRGLMLPLAKAGHDVTVISSVGEKNPPENCTYRDIILTEFRKKIYSEMNFFDMERTNPTLTWLLMSKVIVELDEVLLTEKPVQQLINSGEKFDIIITESIMNHVVHSFASHFEASLILFNSVKHNEITAGKLGHPYPLSYNPTIGMPYSSQMSFLQRVHNVIHWAVLTGAFNFYIHPALNQLVKKYIPNGAPLEESLYNASILLVNTHTSIDDPIPGLPNIIDIGGHWITPAKKLPKDLQDFLDNATDGAIYFSMGSNVKSADLPVEKRDAILKVFSKLKEKVLWKFEVDLPGRPENVKIGKWLPQQEILAHPNVKLFITHAGLLSTTETIYHGKPTLSIPIFGDQKYNARIAEVKGFSRYLPYQELNEKTFEENIRELLNNPKYSDNARLRSKLFHDQETRPLDRAIYWVEYVAKHGGAPHLRNAGLNLTWYQYYSLDVISFLIAISLIGFISTIWILKRVLNKIRKVEKIKTN